MLALALLAIVPAAIFAYEALEIHKDYEGMKENAHEDKPANDCSSEDYEFFNEHVNDNLRNN